MCQSDFGVGLTPPSWPWDSNHKRQCPTGLAALLSGIRVAVTNWLCLTCLIHLIVRKHITRLLLLDFLTFHLFRIEEWFCMFMFLRLNSNCEVYQLVRVVYLFSGFAVCVVAGLYVGMSVCLCSLDSPLARSIFIEQPPQIPTIAKLPAQTHRQYASQSCFSVTV